MITVDATEREVTRGEGGLKVCYPNNVMGLF